MDRETAENIDRLLFGRQVCTAVALLATGMVTAVCLDRPLTETIWLIGLVAMIYTAFGGIVNDIYSDILQWIIFRGGAFVVIGVLLFQLIRHVPDGNLYVTTN